MNKTMIAISFYLCAQLAVAAPVQLNFDRVELTQFLAVTYGDALKKNFVISPQLLSDSKKISLHLDVEREKLPQFLSDYMQRLGIEVVEKDGVVYLSQGALPSPATSGGYAAPMLPPAPAFPGTSTGIVESMPSPVSDKEVRLFRPRYRDADFMVAVLNATFGPATASRAGAQLVLSSLTKDKLDKVQTLAEQIDVAPAKVTVSATFVEVTSNDGKSRGFSLIANVLGARLGASVGSTESNSALSIKTASFESVINALDSDGRFRQVSNPRVIVDEYEKTTITVGDETPTIAGTSLDNNGRQIQQVVYRSSGVILDVLPKVLGNGKIQMNIDGQVSSFQSTTTGVNGSPTLVKRQVKTSLTLDDGEVMVIGGLNDTKSTSSTSGLAFLPKFFSVTNEQSAKTELVLVLSAQVSK